MNMKVKNGVIIDGVLHEATNKPDDETKFPYGEPCISCSLCNFTCNKLCDTLHCFRFVKII